MSNDKKPIAPKYFPSTEVIPDLDLKLKTKRKLWRVKTIGWGNMEDYLNDLEDDNYKVINIFDQKIVDETDGEDYCLVVAKDQKSSQKKRFY